MSTFGKAPTWGSSWKAFIKENADRSQQELEDDCELMRRAQTARTLGLEVPPTLLARADEVIE